MVVFEKMTTKEEALEILKNEKCPKIIIDHSIEVYK